MRTSSARSAAVLEQPGQRLRLELEGGLSASSSRAASAPTRMGRPRARPHHEVRRGQARHHAVRAVEGQDLHDAREDERALLRGASSRALSRAQPLLR